VSGTGLAGLLGGLPISSPATTANRFHHSSSGKGAPAFITRPAPSDGPNVIQRIERVVPVAIWIAMGLALLAAAAGGASALWSRRRVRRHANKFAEISAAAVTDPLTGVLNRRGFGDAVERELARARRYDRPFVLAYVDVRGMKAVNDSEGHRAGDELLRTAAQLLKDSARENDVVGRLGGDEMGILLVEVNDDGASAVRRRIQDRVAERRDAMGFHSHWDLTIGTAAFPQDGETLDELLSTADRRLYEQRGIALLYDDDRR
jgi:diguanylate cyclase (GGDEF)-like protein